MADDGQALVVPGKVLENLAQRMERIDLAPGTDWAAAELMSLEESTVLFSQLCLGELVITQTAWFARRILQRWPLDLVEHPIADQARIHMFVGGVQVLEGDDDAARRILNRALASPSEVDEHPELAGLDAGQLLNVWLALVFWFGIKSGSLHQVAGR